MATTTPKCANDCGRFASKKEHDEGYWNLCDVCFHRDDPDETDKIEGLSQEKLMELLYERVCFHCLSEVNDVYSDYWICWAKDCNRKTCDTCRTALDDKKTLEEMDEGGYICKCCRK